MVKHIILWQLSDSLTEEEKVKPRITQSRILRA